MTVRHLHSVDSETERDNADHSRLMQHRLGPNGMRWFKDLDRALSSTAVRQHPVNSQARTVIVRPPQWAHQPPLYDQAQDRSRIPEGIRLPLTLLLQHVELPGSIDVDAVLLAAQAIRAYTADECDPHGIPRPTDGGAA